MGAIKLQKMLPVVANHKANKKAHHTSTLETMLMTPPKEGGRQLHREENESLILLTMHVSYLALGNDKN